MKRTIAITALLVTAGLANAATNVWEGINGDATSFTDGLNWIGGTAPTDDLTTDIAQLTGGTVNLDASRSVNGLDVNAASTLTGSGNRLTLGGSSITGSSALTLDDGVILRVGTSGLAYSSDVTIQNGAAVEITNRDQGNLGTGTITLDNGSIIGASNHVNMRDTTSIVLGSGGGTFANTHGYAFWGVNNAVISGAGQLTLDGLGSTHASSRIQLDGTANTYTGGTLIKNKANVQVSGDASFGAADTKVTIDDARIVTTGVGTYGAREFAIASGGGRISLNEKNSEIAGLLSGTGALIIDGQNRDSNDATPGGVLRLTSTGNTHSGGITIDGVTVDVQNGTSFGSSVVTLDNGGTIGSEGGHGNLSGLTGIVLGSGGGTLQNKHSWALYNIAAISGDGMLTLDGAGSTAYAGDSRIQLTEDYTYTGGTRIQNKANAVIYKDGSLGAADTKVTIDDGRMVIDASNVDIHHEIEIASGGAAIASAGRTVNFWNPLTGTGALEINGQNRDNDSGTPGGEYRLLGSGSTLTGDVTVRENILVRVNEDNALGTGNLTVDEGATVRSHGSADVALGNSSVTIGAGGANFGVVSGSTLTLEGALSGSGALTLIAGSGTVVLNGDGTYDGLLTVESGTTLGGSGSVDGDLTIADGAKLSLTSTLDVGGTVSLLSTFGVDDVDGFDLDTAEGIYTLIAGAGDYSHIENFGEANAFTMNDGKSAYFENGSLQLTVIPEPATLGLVAAFGAGILFIRRTFMM